MEERRNNTAVEKRLKDRLKNDRARIQVGRISGFGLLEMSRQRLRPGMLEATTAPCAHCHGTGLVRSDDSQALSILREIEEEAVRNRSKEVLLTVPISICNYILNQKREHIFDIEKRFGLSVRIEGSPTMISPEYSMERFKTATRIVTQEADDGQTITIESTSFETGEAVETPANDEEEQPKKKRRRRKRGGRGRNKNRAVDGEAETQVNGADAEQSSDGVVDAETVVENVAEVETKPETEVAEEKLKKPRRTRKKKEPETQEAEDTTAAKEEVADTVEAEAVEEKPKKAPARKRASRAKVKKEDVPVEAESSTPETKEEPKPKPRRTRKKKEAEAIVEVSEPVSEVSETGEVAEVPQPEVVAEEPAPKPKRRGWWSR